MGSAVVCPHCGQAVGAARFAQHLEKCMLGSGRASTPSAASPHDRNKKRTPPNRVDSGKNLGRDKKSHKKDATPSSGRQGAL